MSVPTRQLTQDEQEATKKWLAEKEALRPCPACGHNNWQLIDQMAHLPIFAQGAFIIGAGFPVVVVVCSRCTFFRFHSAIAMGLAKTPEQEATEKKVVGTVTNG